MRRLLWAVLAIGAAGCGEEAKPVEAAMGGMRVQVFESPARIVVRDDDGNTLFDGLAGGVVAAGAEPLVAVAVRHSDSTVDAGFGTFRVEDRNPDPWTGVARFSEIDVPSGELTAGAPLRFQLLDEGGRNVGHGEVRSPAAGQVKITLTAADARANRMSLGFACTGSEHFLGMGGQSWDVDHRGQKVPLWVQEDGLGKDPTDDYEGTWYMVGRRHQTHTPIPIYLSSRGFVAWLDTPTRSIFDFCSTEPEAGRLEVWEGTLRLTIFQGPEPKRAIERMTEVIGRPMLPPAFAFAPWLDALYGSDNVRRVARKLRELDLPSSVIWTEDWRGGTSGSGGYALDEDWRVDRALYPDFETLADDLHALGFKFLTYNNSFVVRGGDVWDEVASSGYSIHDPAGEPYSFMGVTFVDTTLIDFSNPAAFEWTKGVYREGLQLGADGWMADYAEWLPTDISLASGEDPMSAHNLYPVEFQRLHRELLDEQQAVDGVERLFFVRSGYVGSQPLVSVVWAGDQQTDFNPGDGLPSVIPMGIGLGVVGFPYFGHDIGGYQSALTVPTTRELWYRWVTLGALSPVMRTHHGRSAAENWNWESDAASTEHLKRWAVLHMRLLPYLAGLAAEAHETGVPMLRPLALEYPGFDPGWMITDEYVLGDRLIVAPVVEQGATSRRVRLPEGRFFQLLGGPAATMPAGGGETTIAVPLEECPAYVPAGTLLVLLPEGVDTAVDEGVDAAVTSTADAGDDRELWLWPGGSSEWTEAGGRLTYAWEGTGLGAAPTTATWNGALLSVVDGVVTVTGNGVLEAEGGRLELLGGAADRTTVVWFRM